MEIKEIHFVKSAASLQQLPQEGLPEVAFVGRSNVGKSSLLNMLAGRRHLARTSGVPGKTRTFNSYRVNGVMDWQDLPGLGYAKVSKAQRNQWLRMIAEYLTTRHTLRAVVHVIDCRHPSTAVDRDLLLLMRPYAVAYFVALTKADKLSRNGRAASRRQMKETLFECGVHAPVTMCSSKTRLGRAELLACFDALLDGATAPG